MTVVSGHQVAYLPWLGYFHKMALSDVFVFMEQVQFETGSFINRNRVMGRDARPLLLTVPVVGVDKGKPIRDVRVAGTDWSRQHLRALGSLYARAPRWGAHARYLEDVYLNRRWERLADLCWEMLGWFRERLGLSCRVVRDSELGFTAHKSDLVLEHALRFEATTCVVGTNGRSYVDEEAFRRRGVAVHYQDYRCQPYTRAGAPFEPRLSALDLLMFHSDEDARAILSAGNTTREELPHG